MLRAYRDSELQGDNLPFLCSFFEIRAAISSPFSVAFLLCVVLTKLLVFRII